MPKGPRLEDLVDSSLHLLAAPLNERLTSRRFAAFVDGHLTKIRKKLRTVADVDSARDLLLELDVAYRLVQDKRLTLEYEPTPGGRSRGPDFMAHFTTRFAFMLEVTRLKESGQNGERGAVLDARRLAAILALKLGQFGPEQPNVLVVGTDDDLPASTTLGAHMKAIRHDIETTDEAALAKQGYAHRGEYLRRLERLSAVVVTTAPELPFSRGNALGVGIPAARAALWANTNARVPLPNVAANALLERLGS